MCSRHVKAKLFFVVLVFIFGLGFGAKASAAIVYVSNQATNGYAIGNDSNDGLSKTFPKLTGAGALAIAQAGDTVHFNDGTYPYTASPYQYAPSVANLTIEGETNWGTILQNRGPGWTQQVISVDSSSGGLTIGNVVLDGQSGVQNCIKTVATGGTIQPIVINGTKFLNPAEDFIKSDDGLGGEGKLLGITMSGNWFFSSAGGGTSGKFWGMYVRLNSASAGTVSISNGTINQAGFTGATDLSAVDIRTNAPDVSFSFHDIDMTLSSNTATTVRGLKTQGFASYDIHDLSINISGATTVAAVIVYNHLTTIATSCDIYNITGNLGGTEGYLIMVGRDADGGTETNTIQNANIYDNNLSHAGHGYMLGFITDGRIHHNYGSDLKIGLLAKGCTECQFDNNVIEKVVSNSTGERSYIYDKGSYPNEPLLGSGNKFYNNTLVASDGYVGAQLVLVSYGATGGIFKNNIVYTTGVVYKVVNVSPDNGTNSAEFTNNLYYSTENLPTSSFIYQSNEYDTLSSWKLAGHDSSSLFSDPSFISSSNYNLQSTSPAIDAGTDVGLTTDYAGNSIYGLPDIGAHEYQPQYIMGTHEPNTSADVRVYGDGKFRNTENAGGTTADLSVDPASDNKLQYLDIAITTWETSGTREKEWTETSTTVTGNTAHIVGDLEANKYYNVIADDAVTGLTSAACDAVDSNFVCQADENGQITFTWTGGYSTHTFNVVEGDNIDPTVTDSTLAKFHTDTTSVTLSLTTSENSTCKYSTENITYDNMTSFTTAGETSHSTEVNNLTPGNYTYYAICRDGVGNDTSYTLSFEIAAQEDETDINSAKLKEDGDSQKLNDDKKIYYDQKETRIKGEDSTIANGTVKIYKEGKRIATVNVDSDGKWSKKISFGHNKTYTLKIKFYDEYGTLKDTKEYDVKVDTENPIFTDPFPISKSIGRDEKITFTATDDNSGVDFYKVKLLDENGHIVRGWRNQDEDWQKIPEAIDNGTYILMVRVYDKAGNYAEQQIVLNVGNLTNDNQISQIPADSQNTAFTAQTDSMTPNICNYTVQSGDTLWNIAKQVYSDSTQYQKIIDLNKDKYSDIESRLSIGQELTFDCKSNADNNTDLNTDTSENQKVQGVESQNQETQKTSDFKWYNPFSWF